MTESLIHHSHRVRQHFSQAAESYEQAAVLPFEVGRRLMARLEFIKITPAIILDLGANTGRFTRTLAKHFRGAKRVVGLDIAEGLLMQAKHRSSWLSRERFIQADGHVLPLADNSVDLVFSVLMLPWCHDLQQVLADVQRILRPGGLFLFATYGPDTLKELVASWQQVDNFQHALNHLDMHHVGDQLMQTGFKDPVLDIEYFQLQYQSVMHLMKEIKAQGAGFIGPGARPSLTGKQHMDAMMAYYQQHYQTEQGLPATYEIVYGHAWKPVQTKRNTTETIVPISQIQKRSILKP